MAKKRIPLNLFLDTQVFDAVEYNLQAKDFRRLIQLVKDD